MVADPVYTDNDLIMYCAWADYRKEYGTGQDSALTAQGAFISGWTAAQENYSTLSMSAHSVHWRAGYDAFLGTLDIGGVLR
jgi:hypothetical protein